MQPNITPFARRLAENAGVAWWTLRSAESEITERDVLAHLTDVVTGITVTGATRPELSGAADTEIDLSSLAASLADALEDLLAGPTDTHEVSAKPSGAAADFTGLGEFVPGADAAAQSVLNEVERKPAYGEYQTGQDAVNSAELGHVQEQLGAERRAHTEAKVQLGKLEATLKQQQVRAAQLKPLAAEIRRLGSALGVANTELERLRPFEALVGTLQDQLEQALADEARVRLLCRDLQAQIDSDLLAAQQRPRGFFRRR